VEAAAVEAAAADSAVAAEAAVAATGSVATAVVRKIQLPCFHRSLLFLTPSSTLSPSTGGGFNRCMRRCTRSRSACIRRCDFTEQDILDLFEFTGGFSVMPEDEDFDEYDYDQDSADVYDEDYDSFDEDEEAEE